MNLLSNHFSKVAAAAVLTAGLTFAQGPGPRGNHGMRQVKFLTNYLNLDAGQQSQMQTILQNERAAAKPIMESLKQQRQAVEQAIQAGQSQAQVSQLASAEGANLGQLAALRAASQAQIFAMLTPDQQQKMVNLRTMHRRRGGNAAPAAPPAPQEQ